MQKQAAALALISSNYPGKSELAGKVCIHVVEEVQKF
jgi:hypothetical protein